MLKRILFIFLVFMSGVHLSFSLEESKIFDLSTNETWSAFLPLMADKAYDQGYELPLPFGVGLNFIALKRGIEVKEVRAGIGNQLHDVSDLIAVDVTTYVDTLIARLDTWIFPFLNVYVMGGVIENTAEVNARFTIPDGGGGTTNVVLDSSTDLSGTLLGGGITLAAGYADFFLSIDANYAYSALDSLVDENVQITIYSMRSGWNGVINQTPVHLWIGGMYWDSERELSGSAGIVKYEVLQGPVDPMNYLLGTNIELSKSFNILFEYAFNFGDLRMLTVGANYRF